MKQLNSSIQSKAPVLCSKCKSTEVSNHRYCRSCRSDYNKEYRAKNRDKLKEYDKRYSRKWYESNKEAKAQYYRDNSEARKDYARKWLEANPEYKADWESKNRARVAAHGGKQTALKRAPECVADDFDFEATIPFYELRIHMSETTGDVYHVDHIVPLAFGGLHEANNLQVLPATAHRYKNGEIDKIFEGLLEDP